MIFCRSPAPRNARDQSSTWNQYSLGKLALSPRARIGKMYYIGRERAIIYVSRRVKHDVKQDQFVKSNFYIFVVIGTSSGTLQSQGPLYPI